MNSFEDQNVAELEERLVVKTYNEPLVVPEEQDLIDNEIEPTLELTTSHDELSDMKSMHSEERTIKEDKRKMKQSQKEERERQSRMKKERLINMAKEVSLNRSLLSYIEMCVFIGQLNKGVKTLHYYVNRHQDSSKYAAVTDINCYNTLMHGFAAKVLLFIQQWNVNLDGMKVVL